MSNIYEIDIAKGASIIGKVKLTAKLLDNKIQLDYLDSFSEEGSIVEEDYFSALGSLQNLYTERNCHLLCAGCHIDVYPGGLTSEESLNEMAYKFSDKDKTINLINIFTSLDISEIENLADNKAQKAQRRAAIHSKQFNIR